MADSKNPQQAWLQAGALDLWRNEFETAPPAYNSLSGGSQPTINSNDGLLSCCAFERLNAITHPSNHHVFHRTPQLRLIGWVVLCRATDDSLTQEQRFSCPLASCDAQFSENEHMQLVNHVSACSHLEDGEYLCPYHGAIENFMAPTGRPHLHRASKRQFLKRTIGKICRLGSRRPGQFGHHKVGRQNAGDDCSQGRSSSANKRPRLDQISRPIISQPIIHASVFPAPSTPVCALPAELSATVLQPAAEDWNLHVPPQYPVPAGPCTSTVSPVELSADAVPELEGWLGNTYTDCSDPTQYEELPATEAIYQEMDAAPASVPCDATDNRFSNSSWASASESVFTSGNNLSPVSPISRDSYFSIDGFDCPVTQSTASKYASVPQNNPFRPPPISELSLPADYWANLSLAAPPPTIPPTVGRKSPRPIPSIRVDTSFNSNAPPPVEQRTPFSATNSSLDSPVSENWETRDSGLFSRVNLPPKESEVKDPKRLVWELRGLFNTLFKVSLRKLCTDPTNMAGHQLLSWNTSPAVLFERGMRALQKVVQGEMPNDISGIFGLSLLTYACGLADVDFTMPEQFSSIFEEQLRWSCAIDNDADRDLYTSLVHQLWAPAGQQARTSAPPMECSSYLRESSYTQADLSKPEWDLWAKLIGSDSDAAEIPFAGVAELSKSRPSSRYLHGAAIGLCQRFLDHFEYIAVDLNELDIEVPKVPDFGLNLSSDMVNPSRTNREILMNSIIRPLTSNPALQSFLSVVEKASLLLDTFPNMPLRNTELSLMQEAKDHDASQLLRHAFTSEVQRLSDEASSALGCGNYRSWYYGQDIDKILALHGELLAHEAARVQRGRSVSLGSAKGKAAMLYSPTFSPTSSHLSDSSFPATPYRPWSVEAAVASSNGSRCSSEVFHSRSNSNEDSAHEGMDPLDTVNPADITYSPISPFIASHSAPVSSAQSPMPSYREESRRHTAARHSARSLISTGHHELSPTSVPQACNSPSGLSQPPLISTPDSVPAIVSPSLSEEKATQTCRICGQRFSGKAQWIRANVTRHIREKHRGNARKLVCGEPHCRYSSTRRGNVDHHRRTVHGLES